MARLYLVSAVAQSHESTLRAARARRASVGSHPTPAPSVPPLPLWASLRVEPATTNTVTIAGRQFGIGCRIIRINGYRLFEILNGFLSILRPTSLFLEKSTPSSNASCRICLAPGELLLSDRGSGASAAPGHLAGNISPYRGQVCAPRSASWPQPASCRACLLTRR